METVIIAIIIGVISTIYNQLKKNIKGTPQLWPLLGNRLEFQRVNKKTETGVRNQADAQVQEAPSRPIRKRDNVVDASKKEQLPMNGHEPESFIDTENQEYPVNLPEEKTLIDAVIWSEILGEPRGKRPYFTRKN